MTTIKETIIGDKERINHLREHVYEILGFSVSEFRNC